MSIYTVKGCVKYKDGSVAKGLTVRAFDSDSNESKQLGLESETDDKGCYRIYYSNEQLMKPETKKPNLLVKVFEGNNFKASESKQNADENEIIDFTLGGEEIPGHLKGDFSVKGCVKTYDGDPAKGITVIASDFDPKISKPLGEAITNDQGYYIIEYKADQLVNPKGNSPYLIVQAKKEGQVIIGARKPNAEKIEVINLTLPDPDAFIVRGTVYNKDRSYAKGITVTAHDFDPKSSKLLGETITDDYGYYSIEYKADQLINPAGKSAYLIIQAKREGKVLVGGKKPNAGKVEIIDLTLPDPDAFIVRGTVYNKDRSFAKGKTVIAHDFDPKSPKLLGETITDDYGYYSIEYKVDQLVNPKRRSPYLIVEAKRDSEAVSAERPNAAQIEIIDLVFVDWIVSDYPSGEVIDTNVPVATRVVFGFVKYLGGNIVRSGVDVKLMELYNGMFFDIAGAMTSRANGSFRIEYTLNRFRNPNMPNLFIQAINYGKPCTEPIRIEGALSEGPIDLIYMP